MHSIRNRKSPKTEQGFKSSTFRCCRSSIGRAPDCGSGIVGVQFPSVTQKGGLAEWYGTGLENRGRLDRRAGSIPVSSVYIINIKLILVLIIGFLKDFF